MRGGMVVSILVLVVLILVTPFLQGRPPSELASLPLLIIGMNREESAFIVHLGAAVQAYQYAFIRVTINGSAPVVNASYEETDAYGLYRWVPRNGTAAFSLNVYFVDRQKNYFEYNVTAATMDLPNNRTVMVFTFPYERDNVGREVRREPPDDFRLVVPSRGRLP